MPGIIIMLMLVSDFMILGQDLSGHRGTACRKGDTTLPVAVQLHWVSLIVA